MTRKLANLLPLFLLLMIPPHTGVAAEHEPHVPAPAFEWVDQRGNVQLYIFWSLTCPHCQEALPVVESLAETSPWLNLHSLEISQSEENRARYRMMAAAVGQQARSVPAFLFCGVMAVGYHPQQTPVQLEQLLQNCHQQGGTLEILATERPLEVLPGGIDLQKWSLPMMTLFIAAMDAFNPCAFFVLLFLLSLLTNTADRWRMAFIGGTFIFVSGAIYFMFMAAWLNLFLYIGEMAWVTRIAALIALLIAMFNIKDYFLPNTGPSLSIPEQGKPRLFQHMRALLSGDALWPLIVATVTLAIVANSYELLCTSGLPMVYTRILTMQQLPTSSYYGYLLLYNLIYIIPLLLIVTLFTYTLGRRKLKAYEGALLKLLSGLMMLGLGLVLLVAPALLSSIKVTAALLVGSIVVTLIAYRLHRDRTLE